MGFLSDLDSLIERCREDYAVRADGTGAGDDLIAAGLERGSDLLIEGDSAEVMGRLLAEKEQGRFSGFKCIYADPPFFTKTKFDATVKFAKADAPSAEKDIEWDKAMKVHAYEDHWDGDIMAYLKMLTESILMMRGLLDQRGMMFLHLDSRVVYYARLIMDEIFGRDNFINEIIWYYKSGGSSKKHFSRKHDTILMYAAGKDYEFHAGKEKSYNRGMKPYHFKGVEEYKDETGWYTLVNQKDVWTIDMVGRTSGERTGYATQKPQALMKRIIECCTKEGDLCGDFFCGSGSFAAAANEIGRRWICSDKGPLAVSMAEKRLSAGGADMELIYTTDAPRGIECRVTSGIFIYPSAEEGEEAGEIGVPNVIYYKIPERMIPVKDGDLERVKKAMDICPGALVSFMVPASKDGHTVYRGGRALVQEDGGLMKVVDIFGNRAVTRME